MDKNTIEKKINELGGKQQWFHDIELPYGLKTVEHPPEILQGNYPSFKWTKLQPILPILKNKNVLDIASNEGFYSFKLGEAGVRHVTGIEIDDVRFEKACFLKEILHSPNVEFVNLNMYNMKEYFNETFDFALCLGLLHRLPDPYTAIKLLTEVAESVIFEWCAWDVAVPAMRSIGGQYKKDKYNTGYWLVSRNCVKQILQRHHFYHFVDIEPYSRRAILFATKNKDVYEKISKIHIKHDIKKKIKYLLTQSIITMKTAMYFMKSC